MYRNPRIYWGEKTNIKVDNEGIPSSDPLCMDFSLGASVRSMGITPGLCGPVYKGF
jgi:hypothetical protein